MGKPLPASIEGKLGIKQRYVTGDEFSSADLATNAAKAAIADAGIKPEDIDMVIVTSDTPEYISPPTSSVVQGRLGAVNAGTFDMNASCAGFTTALDVASRMIGYDTAYKNILLCGVYNMTKFVNWEDEKVAPIFADGGGAVVLQATEGENGYLAAKVYADGTQYDLLGIFVGGTKIPVTKERVENKEHYLTFLKPLPPARNIELWPKLVPQALQRAGLEIKDIDHILFTQINKWVIEEVMKVLDLPMEKTTCIMDKYGYTGSACLPMALNTAINNKKIKPGDIVVLVGSGVGLSVSVAVFRW
jgi:3-oxoacyl-[acyl-carrier-protein] synthase-3